MSETNEGHRTTHYTHLLRACATSPGAQPLCILTNNVFKQVREMIEAKNMGADYFEHILRTSGTELIDTTGQNFLHQYSLIGSSRGVAAVVGVSLAVFNALAVVAIFGVLIAGLPVVAAGVFRLAVATALAVVSSIAVAAALSASAVLLNCCVGGRFARGR